MQNKLKAFERLLIIMDELRTQCPWDKKQTIQSLRHLTIEETYELADAILDENMQDILDTYKSWGSVGVKVDFMQRADQYMVNSYENIAIECAKRELLVDYHGAFKPAGLRRAYPNVLSYEGVRGNEHNKWGDYMLPKHNITLPFIRMAAGPMDYTPGAMRNAQENSSTLPNSPCFLCWELFS